MTKVPTRSYCSTCNKGKHGKNCKGAKCNCKCRNMTEAELDELHKKYHDEVEYVYTPQENENFEKLMAEWKEKQEAKKPNIQEVPKPQ